MGGHEARAVRIAVGLAVALFAAACADDGWEAVELPLAGDQLAMWILLPAGARTPHELLSPDSLAAVATGLAPRQVELSLPRWDFDTDLDLRAALGRLGVVRAFSGEADFAAIHAGLGIDQAVHRATITVDEWGVEAAAVTGLSFAESAPAPATAVVRADRPFAFAIVHTPTRVPLFVGHVADPAAGG